MLTRMMVAMFFFFLASAWPAMDLVDNLKSDVQVKADRLVGAQFNRCCAPGHRKGCDPEGLNLSGCVGLEFAIICEDDPAAYVECTTAACGTKEKKSCDAEYERVGQNYCDPTGDRTTEGCPEDQWQCEVNIVKYSTIDCSQYPPPAGCVDVAVCTAGTDICADPPTSVCD